MILTGVLSFTGAVNRMIHSIVTAYSNYLVKKGIITESERELQEYGLTAFLVFICNYALLLLLAAFTGTIAETVIFLLSYSILRNIIGGWHADTPLLCMLCGIVMWSIVMLLFHFLHIPKVLLAILTLVSSGTLMHLIHSAEINDKRKHLGTSMLALILFVATLSFMSIIDSSYSYLVLYSLLCNIVMNIPIYHT